MSPTPDKPLVGIPASVRQLEHSMKFHGTGEQYLDAVIEQVDARVITIPSLSNTDNALGVLGALDGLLLTGSFSNVHPSAYGDDYPAGDGFFDRQRDENTIRLIRAAITAGLPFFGICRGLQELNVAYGGTLNQEHHLVPGMRDHRSDPTLELPEQFRPAHDIAIEPGGVVAGLFPDARVTVNTSHMQSVARVADRLRIEATADDGTVEILSVRDAKNFALAVQFHPEWHTGDVPFYQALFGAFRAAVHEHRDARVSSHAPGVG